jgi:hypothetical protein
VNKGKSPNASDAVTKVIGADTTSKEHSYVYDNLRNNKQEIDELLEIIREGKIIREGSLPKGISGEMDFETAKKLGVRFLETPSRRRGRKKQKAREKPPT